MDVFYALAEPTRRDIIEILARGGQLTASDISSRFKVSAAAISQHLKVLREAHLVKMEKHAQQHIYQIDPAGMDELEDWAKQMRELGTQRFDALEKLLQQQQQKL